jgi:urease accessory protein
MEPIAVTALSAGIGGMLHPLATPAHLIALAGLGLMAGRNSPSVGIASVAAFALGLAAGLGAVASGIGETPANDVLLAGAILCGLLAASAVRASSVFAAPVALVSGAALGLDSPPDAIRISDAVAALIGTACGGVTALAAITLLAFVLARRWRGIALRVAGSWIAAVAILVLAVRWAS